MAATKNFDQEDMKELIRCLTEVPNQVEVEYIKPCETTLRECGLEAEFQAKIDNAADKLIEQFQMDLKQFGVIRANFVSYDKDFEKLFEESMAQLNKLSNTIEDQETVQVEERGPRF